MIQGIIGFVALTLLIAAGASMWSVTTTKEKIEFFKLLGRSSLYAGLAVTILFGIVLFF